MVSCMCLIKPGWFLSPYPDSLQGQRRFLSGMLPLYSPTASPSLLLTKFHVFMTTVLCVPAQAGMENEQGCLDESCIREGDTGRGDDTWSNSCSTRTCLTRQDHTEPAFCVPAGWSSLALINCTVSSVLGVLPPKCEL